MREQRAPLNSEEARDHSSVLQPEQELWIAVLQRAFLDLRDGIKCVELYQGRKVGRIKVEARFISHYFQSDDFYIGSFRWICEQIYEEPENAISAIRKIIRGIDLSRKTPQ